MEDGIAVKTNIWGEGDEKWKKSLKSSIFPNQGRSFKAKKKKKRTTCIPQKGEVK